VTSQIGITEYKRRFAIVPVTAKWAVIMTQVAIRRAIADKPWPRWHFVKFDGKSGGESRGVVDLIAVRKDHSEYLPELKRCDALQIILIQVKGGSAAMPTDDDAERLRAVARRHGACKILLATWKRGRKAQFYSLENTIPVWRDVDDLRTMFG
jgi:hypothetical protein